MPNEFQHFEEKLKSCLMKPLPGAIAHDLLAPEHRKSLLLLSPDSSMAQLSSVLALFYPDRNNKPMVVFIKRVEYKGVHSGQISFPGGRMEEHDIDRFETALRETEEEIGITRDDISVIGALSELYVPPSNFNIFPVVATMAKEPDFNIDPIEVAQAISVPFEFFIDKKSIGYYPVLTSDMITYKVPGFMVNGNLIWGATAMILSELIQIYNDF